MDATLKTHHMPLDPKGNPLNPWAIAITVALTTFMEVLDISIANVSLRHIAGDLSAGQDESTWVLTSYMVSNAIVLPMSGWLSNLLGRRKFYLSCVALFTISSLLCGLSPNLPLLILFRTLQGIGGGGLQPSSQAILADTFPPKKRGMAFAVYGITTVLAPAIGPTVGGWITDNFTWRWIFLINVPVGILSVYFCSRLVFDPPHFAEQRKALLGRGFKIDYIGFALLALGFGCLQIMLDKGQEDDWFDSGFIIIMAAVAAVSLVTLPFWEWRQRDPMVDVKLLLKRNFLISNLLIFMLGFVLFASTVLLPIFLQTLMGYSATDAGFVLSPGGVTVLFFMPLIGYMVGRFDVRHMITFGILCNVTSLYLLAHVNLQTDYWTLATLRVIQGVGLGFLFIPINTAAFDQMPMVKSSNASSLINLFRNLGGSVGISLVQTWLTRGTQQHQVDLVAQITPESTRTQSILNDLANRFFSNGSFSTDAILQSKGALYGIVQQQASLLSFMDDFRRLSLMFLVFIPVVYILKAPGKKGQVKS